jgi:glycosyltransferase involved in cell wall biosynthesis
LKILHISYIYPQRLGVADGITNVVYNITKELAKRGHEVSVYTSNMLDLNSNNTLRSGHLIVNGVNVYHSMSVWHSKTFIVTPGLIPLLSKDLNAYDVIHIHDSRSFQGISAYLFSKIKNVPFVYQPHGSYLPLFSGSLMTTVSRVALDKLVSGSILQNASKIIALSQFEANLYKCAGVSACKIAIVPNGIDLSNYSNLPTKGSFKKKFNIPENKKIVLYLGRLHRTKGIELLIKSYVYLTQTLGCTDCFLVIAGPDDGYLDEAKSLLASLNACDSALFTGYLDEKDKLGAMVDASLFVTPSFFGFPMTFLEACITGTPIVTTTLGDELEWINGNVGYVTAPNPSDMAKAAYGILFNQIQSMYFSERCRSITTTYSIEKVTDELEHVYEVVASR